jgi:hypothetical protein
LGDVGNGYRRWSVITTTTGSSSPKSTFILLKSNIMRSCNKSLLFKIQIYILINRKL